MNLALKLLASPWFWLDIILSVTGGIIVWWGLIVEKKAERLLPPDEFKPDLFDEIVKKQKREVERGWRILMAGIVFEVVAAFGISVISGLEIADLKEKTSANESSNLVLRTKVVSLESAMLKLAHQYDLSTNALAEARARLASITPRMITAEQRRIILAMILPLTEKGDVSIFSEGNDPEIAAFKKEIENLLAEVGFKNIEANTISTTSAWQSGAPPTGLNFWVQTKFATNPPVYVKAIVNAFRAAQIPIRSVRAQDDIGRAPLEILVGPRPIQ